MLIDGLTFFDTSDVQIPPDHFQTMRMHPEFENVIAPAIAGIRQAIAEGQIHLPASNTCFDLPKLLGLDSNTNNAE